MNVPYLYAEMRRQKYAASPSRWASKANKFESASRAGMAIATVLYLLTAIGGYAAFGTLTSADVLDNFVPGPACPLPDAVIVALRAAFIGTMIATYPTISYGLRQSLHALAFPHRDETAWFRWTEAAGLVGTTVAVAVAVDDLGLVFQLAGSTCANVVMLLLPAALHLRQRTAAPAGGGAWWAAAYDNATAWAVLAIGASVLLFVVYDNIF